MFRFRIDSSRGRLDRRGIILTLGALLAASAAAQAGTPVIKVEPELLDFGTMNQEESRSERIVISNVGDDVLKIRDVRTTCGCTATELDVEELAPGESASMEVVFNSKKFEGDQTKFVRIYSNDPENSLLEYPVLAFVRVAVLVTPSKRQLNFGKVHPGQTVSRKATFSTEDVETLQLNATRFNTDLFEVEIQSDPEGHLNRGVMIATSKPTTEIGRHREFIRVETNVPGSPFIEFEAFLEVIRDLEVLPETINFRYVQRNQDLSQRIVVRSTTRNLEWQITGAEIDIPQFTATVADDNGDGPPAVELSGTPLATSDPRAIEAKGRIKGTLRIFTDLESVPELTVPVTYLLKM